MTADVVVFTATLINVTNASDFAALLGRMLGLRPGSVVVTSYNAATHTVEFYFTGADASKAMSTLLALSDADKATLLGISGLSSKTADLSNLTEDDSVERPKSSVVATVIAVLCANIGVCALLVTIRTYTGGGDVAAQYEKSGVKSLADVISGNTLPHGAAAVDVHGETPALSRNNGSTYGSPPPPPPGTAPPQQSLKDLGLDLDDDDDFEL